MAVGANSFGGGFGNPNFGDAPYIIVGTITLVSCIAYNIFAKSFYKQLSVLFGLIVGYVVAYFMGMVNMSKLAEVKLIAIPQLMPFTMEFHPDAIFAFFLIFLVSATETIGDTSAMTAIGLRRDVKEKRNFRFYCLRWSGKQLVFRFRLPAYYLFQPERRPDCYDKGC